MHLDAQLANIVKQAADNIHKSEKFPVPVLAVKAEKAAQENPHDAPLVTASNVLKKMASDNRMFISRAELNDIYDKLYTPNTKLADLFADELGRAEQPGPKVFQRSEFEDQPLSQDYERIGDPVLLNALQSAFDGGEAKLYSNVMAKRAEKSCMAELLGLGLTPKKVDVFAGQEDILVCQATYETPKGQSHVLVPVEVKEDQALLPTMFLSQAGFMDLSADNLKQHIADTAGKSFKVDGQALLKVLSNAKNGVKEVVGDVDLAVTKMRAEAQGPVHDPNGILYQQVDNHSIVKDPEFEQPVEHVSLAARLSSPRGMAEQVFGASAVEAGRNMLSRKLADFGYKYAQVNISDVEENKIVYSVAVDRAAGFKVPVVVKDSLVHPPSIIISAGNIAEFSKAGIAEATKGIVDKKAIAESSPLYGVKPSDLMCQVREGIAEGNLVKAEDAIDVLSEADPEAHKRAVALMMESFNPNSLKKVASQQSGCSMVVNSSASKHPLCGHLNRPVHEVYQDVNGDCQPLYRKGVEETSEGGTFMAHKILHY